MENRGRKYCLVKNWWGWENKILADYLKLLWRKKLPKGALAIFSTFIEHYCG